MCALPNLAFAKKSNMFLQQKKKKKAWIVDMTFTRPPLVWIFESVYNTTFDLLHQNVTETSIRDVFNRVSTPLVTGCTDVK